MLARAAGARPLLALGARGQRSLCSGGLTHVDGDRQMPTMVDVQDKAVTVRHAWARTVVTLPDFRADYNEHTQDIGRFTLDYVEGVMDARLSVHGDRLMLAFFGERPRRHRVRRRLPRAVPRPAD